MSQAGFSVAAVLTVVTVQMALPLPFHAQAGRAVSANAAPVLAPNQVCAGTAPAGFVTTAISGACSLGMGRSAVIRTIKNTAGLPTGTKLSVCGPFDEPAGWALVAVNANACFSQLGTTYLSAVMMNLNGLPAKTTMDICGLPAPAGWHVLAEEPVRCSTGPTSYLKYKIVKD